MIRLMRRPRAELLAASAIVVALAMTGLAPSAAPPAVAGTRDPRSALTSSAASTAARTYEITSRVHPSRPVRWPACHPIQYRINPAGMPKGMRAVVRRVMRSIGRQTGVSFTDAGRTTHTFGSAKHAAKPTIYFAFTAKTHAGGQTFSWPGEIGVGGPASAWMERPGAGTYESIVYGRVLLSTKFRAPRTGAGVTWESLIRHEVGHALNLDHRKPATDVMHASLTARSPDRFSAKEVAALKRVLQTSGCDDAAWSQL